jgi:hypothetical protein
MRLFTAYCLIKNYKPQSGAILPELLKPLANATGVAVSANELDSNGVTNPTSSAPVLFVP